MIKVGDIIQQRITIYFKMILLNFLNDIPESCIKLRTLLENKELKYKGDCDTYTKQKEFVDFC